MHMQQLCSTPPENYRMHPLILRALIIIIVKETSVLYCSMWPSLKISGKNCVFDIIILFLKWKYLQGENSKKCK